MKKLILAVSFLALLGCNKQPEKADSPQPVIKQSEKELTQEDIQLGEMAHIIAKKSNGPRGNEKNENNN